MVVTVFHGRHVHLARQREGLARSSIPAVHVVVGMDDDHVPTPVDGLETWVVDVAPHPLGLPLAAARNRGVEEALRQDPDVVVLLDVDCIPGPTMLEAYAGAAARHGDALLCGPVTYLPPAGPGGPDLDHLDDQLDPHPARPAPEPGRTVLDADGHRLFWSLSFAVTPSIWQRIGGFDEVYVGYGGEDTDLGQRARQQGVPIAWTGGAHAFHQHHPVSRPPVEHVEDILRNGALFHDRWGWWPMQGWLDAFEELDLVRRTPDGWVQRPACEAN
ncbi:MAG: glycosyltransferase family 2 protein [Actinomycetales bacterium]|nr:MAG: glycosyltransferase family 2 protein [Actinomycetales bacterium]